MNEDIETIILNDEKTKSKIIVGKDEVRRISTKGIRNFLLHKNDLYNLGKDEEYHLICKGYATEYKVPK